MHLFSIFVYHTPSRDVKRSFGELESRTRATADLVAHRGNVKEVLKIPMTNPESCELETVNPMSCDEWIPNAKVRDASELGPFMNSGRGAVWVGIATMLAAGCSLSAMQAPAAKESKSASVTVDDARREPRGTILVSPNNTASSL